MTNSNNEFLLDDWSVSGSGLEGFKEAVKFLEERTEYVPVNSASQVRDKDGKDGVFHFWDYDKKTGILRAIAANQPPEGNRVIDARLGKFSMFNNTGSDDVAIMKELEKTSGCILRFYNVTYLLSTISYLTLQARLKFGEDIWENSIERDFFMSSLLRKRNAIYQLCVRKNKPGDGPGTIRKIFAVLSEKYAIISQMLLVKIAEMFCDADGPLGKGEVAKYSVDHRVTRVLIRFPEKAKEVADTYHIDLSPAIVIQTSSVGFSSFKYYAAWERNGSYILIDDSFKIKHMGKKPDAENILKEIEQKVFPLYTAAPERLAKAMTIPVPHVEETVKAISKYIKLVESINKGGEMAVVKDVVLETEDPSCTLYDILSVFLDLPGRLQNVPKTREKMLKRQCYKAIFYDPDAKPKKNDGEDIFLSV